MLKYLIICPLVFLAGFVDAIAGGGGLISLPAYLIVGLPAHNAIATNKCSATMGTAVATFQYARKGYIPWKEVLCCVVTAFAGSSLGASLALRVSDFYFKLLMLIILPVTAFYVTRPRALTADREPYGSVRTALTAAGVSLAVGIYDGFYGPGTGTFLILLLTALAHMDLKTANGTTKVINLSTNVAALSVFLLNGKVLFPLGPIAGCFGIAGNYIGANFFDKGGAKAVRPVMITVIAVFFVKVLLELLGVL